VIDERGRMTAAAGPYAGLDRAEARERVVADLEAAGALVKVEPHTIAIGQCYRCHSVVEPLLSTQWFVRAKPLADPAIEAVQDGRTRFFPEHWSKTYFAWLTNIRDWCISRQLWWGHRIPAWYCDRCLEPGPDGEPVPRVIVAREEPPACPDCGGPLRQDEDVLDTWFSSGLWPLSTLGWPDRTPDLERYYPTSVLVTGFDILFFWVARMMMFGLRFTGEVPFHHVYVHGLVRDEYGAKMSKSKGNVQDPLELLATYGTDALRFTLAAQSAMGRDIRLSLERIDGNRSFANKIWNAARFVLMNLADYTAGGGAGSLAAADRWILTRLSRTVEDMRAALDSYRFNDAAQVIYRFLWNEFCDWYVELAKLSLASGDPARRRATQTTLVTALDAALRLLHPLMPFITEELRQALPPSADTTARAVQARYPRSEDFARDLAAEADVERLIDVVRVVRNLRAEMNLPPSRRIDVHIGADPATRAALEGMSDAIRALGRVEALGFLAPGERPRGTAVATAGGAEIFVPLAGLIDVAAERDRLSRGITRVDQELAGVRRKLENESFIARAPEEIVAKERAREDELATELALLRQGLERLAEVAE
jgi:valyl-tRNA synthetase